VDRFREVVDILLRLLDWVTRWLLAPDPTPALAVLALIFDSTRQLYRASSSTRQLEDVVLDLERNGKGASERYGDPAKALVHLTWEAVNNRLVIYLVNYFGSIGGFEKIIQVRPIPQSPFLIILEVFFFALEIQSDSS
jgi:hypothetical protein